MDIFVNILINVSKFIIIIIPIPLTIGFACQHSPYIRKACKKIYDKLKQLIK